MEWFMPGVFLFCALIFWAYGMWRQEMALNRIARALEARGEGE